MVLVKSGLKISFFWTISISLTFLNFLVFVVSRSEFWITHPGQAWLASDATANRTFLASEFERNLSCYQPLTCLRSGGAFLSQFLIWTITTAAELVTVDLNLEQRTFIILLVGTLWRFVCLSIFLLSLSRLLNSFRLAILITNTLMFVLAGLPLWLLGRVLVNVPLGFDDAVISRANDAFYHMSYQELFFYDYGFIAIIPLAMYALATINDISKISPKILLLVGFLAATFYEAFIPLLVLSGAFFIWSQQKKVSLCLLWLLVGQMAWTVSRAFSIRFLELSDPASPFFRDTSLPSILMGFSTKGTASTKDSLPSIVIQLLIVACVALAISFLSSIISIFLKIDKLVLPRNNKATNSVTLATSVIIVGGYFTPKLVELGRQSLGLTVAVLIFGFIKSQNMIENVRFNRRSIEQAKSESTTAVLRQSN